MYLKVFFPTKEEKAALKTWVKQALFTITHCLKKWGMGLGKFLLDISLLVVLATLLGFLVNQLFPFFNWSFGNKVSHMLAHYFTQKHYFTLIALYTSLGGALIFPILFTYLTVKTIYKLIKGIIYLSVHTVQSSTQMYEQRKDAMLPMLEKDKLEANIQSQTTNTPKKKVKL